MIRYRIKNRTIEIEYDTGLELKYITSILNLLDILNEIKEEKK